MHAPRTGHWREDGLVSSYPHVDYGMSGASFDLFVMLNLLQGIVSWPVAKLLEFILGPHHGIMYRRSELKELIAMHATTGELGGDLKTDTVTIIGATLDLQEKVVKQAMTPIEKVFMLNIESKLDYETMKLIDDTGHSRVPVYEEIEVPMVDKEIPPGGKTFPIETQKVKKIVGILLVKRVSSGLPSNTVPLSDLSPLVPYARPQRFVPFYHFQRFRLIQPV